MIFDAKRMIKEGLPTFYPAWGRFAHYVIDGLIEHAPDFDFACKIAA